MNQTVVRTSGLSKKYNERYAVENVSIELQRGQIYGLIGQNGAGKTTLIRMLTGLITPDAGQLELFGQTGPGLQKARQRIGSIVETPSLFPGMTAAENLDTQLRLAGMHRIKATMEFCGIAKVEETLELCGIADTGKKKVRDFSLGMKQRLALALCLITEPELIILDEPINGLDPKGIVENREMLKLLAQEQKITILVSSHILSELSQFATNYGIIHHGRLIKQIPAKQLQAECRQCVQILTDDMAKAVEILRNEFNVKQYEVASGGELRVFEQLDQTARMNEAFVRAGVSVRSINVMGQDLEGYFMNLTGGEL
jgi:ABC-2 type transport system ATP-binding protein